jgi:hypothetical protein
MKVKVRIDSVYVPDEALLVDTLLSVSGAPQDALIVEEQQPKKHYHIFLDETKSLPTIRNKLKEVLQIPESKKNNAYSVSDKHNNWPGYIAYLVKQDDTRIVYNKTYNVAELKTYYGEVSSKNINAKKTRIEEFEKYIEDKEWETPVDLAKLVRKWYWSKKQTFHKADMARIVQTIWYGNYQNVCVFDEQIVQEADIGYLSRPPSKEV